MKLVALDLALITVVGCSSGKYPLAEPNHELDLTLA